MRLTYLTLTLLSIGIFSSSCRMAGNTENSEGDYYTSRDILIYTYLDSARTDLYPSSEVLFNSSGSPETKYEYQYAGTTENGYINTTVNFYSYKNGEWSLTGKVDYGYMQDFYDGGTSSDYILNSEKYYTYTGGAFVLDSSSEVCYDGNAWGSSDSDTSSEANYSSYIEYDSSGSRTSSQYSDYITLPDGSSAYRWERYYDGNDVLTEEYVCHYNAASPYDYQYEMYHAGGDENLYYYTLFSRNAEGLIYDQSDFTYDPAGLIDADGNFFDTDSGADDDPCTQSIALDKILQKQTVIQSDYGIDGNRIRKRLLLNGSTIELTRYSYDSDGNLLTTLIYSNGGNTLTEKETITYSEGYDDENNYNLTITTYSYEYESIAEGKSVLPNNEKSEGQANRNSFLTQNHRTVK